MDNSARKQIDSSWHPLADGAPPIWADAWGRDRDGVWVAFTLQGVKQRLRWIPPGEFLMGSPESESGRYEDEGPQHAVTITQGFWLFDTQVTQALWQAVMGDNPSNFKSPQRPVENVSWADTQQFLHTINQKIPQLQLQLPSEAQWEYACRAGTDIATYAGPMDILGENNAPVLDNIAWYGGNSGVDFELDNGYDASDWSEKHYDFQQAGSHPVGQKQQNPWGLYDMLGNVWEWCADGMRDYSLEPRVDVAETVTDASLRVIRGGSWFDYARLVRAAFRNQDRPDERDDFLGFRCARVQA